VELYLRSALILIVYLIGSCAEPGATIFVVTNRQTIVPEAMKTIF